MTEQFSLFDDAEGLPHARRDGPQTSRDAAARITTLSSDCGVLLKAYQQLAWGATREEAGDLAGLDQWAASKRNSDLLRLGLIEPLLDDNGMKVHRRARSNRDQDVSVITLAGRTRLLREL